MSNIFQISKELLEVIDELEENGGELTEELESRLVVSQADFKTKVKSYADAIKHIESDIKAIDEETSRLKKLKESKSKTIDRLEKIVIWAIEMFGETTKSGGKYFDYDTGKITVRNSTKVEVNDEFAKDSVDRFMNSIRELAFTKELYYNDLEDTIDISKEEIEGLTANISFDIPLKDIYSANGYNIIKTLYNYNQNFKSKANISKSELKDVLKDNPDAYPNLAHLGISKTISIK